jgi:hypothetical protein
LVFGSRISTLWVRPAATWLLFPLAFARAQEVAPVQGPIILTADRFAHYGERFSALDEPEDVVNLVPNAEAWEWITRNAPLWDCPSARFEETYYYRWWTYRKHIKQTPHGRVLTEFITPVKHAGPHNTIACAVGHHIAEGRWLRDADLLDEYVWFWFRGGPSGDPAPHFHNFSSWVPAALWERAKVTGNISFLVDLLDDLRDDYARWENERLLPGGLFWQHDVKDGMEESISGGRHVKNVRPTINSYMVANARAIAEIARAAGRADIAEEFRAKAEKLRAATVDALWNPAAEFFQVRLESGELSGVREAIGYIPWAHDVAGPEHVAAWKQVSDRQGFWAPRGLTTAERRHPQFRTHGTGTCEWDGAVWPFATSQTLTAMARLLRTQEQPYVTRRHFFEQLLTYATTHQQDGQAYLGEYHDEITGDWLITGPKAARSRFYNHSTFNDLVITGLVGIVPRADDVLEIDPLLPADAWDWFCLDGVPYRGHAVTVLWDRTGARYGRGAGLSVWVDGQLVAQRAQLQRLEVSLPKDANDQEDRLTLWYDRPARQWTEALPVGNGRLGAMVFGEPHEARFQFNEDSLWTGGPHSYAREGAHAHLGEIRKLLFAGKQREAEELATREFMSQPMRQRRYQPCGDLLLCSGFTAEPTEYRRSLDLDTAVATTTFRVGDVRYVRRTFASFPARALVIELTCDQPGGLNFSASVTSPHPETQTNPVDSRTLLLAGRVSDETTRDGQQIVGATRFATHVRVVDTDGQVASNPAGLGVQGASRATLLLTAATSVVDYRDVSADPVARSQRDLTNASARSPAELYAAHVEDHQQLFRRVELRLDSPPVAELPTDQRLLASQQIPDPALAALLFHYGRYLMIASSRPGGQPANLQGLWNDQLEPSWDSKYTVNINTEMNYWLTDPCQLPECAEPLFDALREVAESGAETARAHYGAPGWVLHHNFDLWRGTAPINAANHGIWPTGGAWLCEHLWQRFLYSGDEQFLRERAYPLMRGAARFFAHYLIADPRSGAGSEEASDEGSNNRWLISGPSNSPEQGGLVMGPTMDHQIIRSLFANTIEASRILAVDPQLRADLQEMLPRIAPNQIGRHGQLQEWLEDIDDPQNEHRHVSHLWGLHPGAEITPDTPELFAAARRSLEMRGDEGTGWSRAWKINFWARLRDGDRALKVLRGLMTLTDSLQTTYRGGGLYPNLFDAHPPFQIDGNFGLTAGICEMLVQSHRHAADGTRLIELLPALPAAWPSGEVRGLRARDGIEIDLAWHTGRLVRCRVQSVLGRPITLRSGDHQVALDLAAGESLHLDERLQRAGTSR